MKFKKLLIAFASAVALAAGCTLITRAAASEHQLHGQNLNTSPLSQPTLPDSVRPVFDNYLKIHAALAQDSLQGLAENAKAIAQAVRTNPAKPFPLRLARQADRLANAKDLKDARDAFLRVSPHLIDYVKKNRLPGYYLGYCRMQKLAWLQADPTIANPYMGKAMPRCAWFRELNPERHS